MRLKSYLNGRWLDGEGQGTALHNPVTGSELARTSGKGLDLPSALGFGREKGGAALRSMTYAERGLMLREIVDVLMANRERYFAIALENSGNTSRDAALDVDGGIGTLKYYAKLGQQLGDSHYLTEGESEQLTRDPHFQSTHVLRPMQGIAVHINAFNFPSWGMWEKAAVAFLSGVPVFVKPAAATALMSYEMVEDLAYANVLPEGALSLICGDGRELMDHVSAQDVVAFTGSADTARLLRSNANVIAQNVRFNVEADSLNSTLLGPDLGPEAPGFEHFICEVVSEMTVKAGQKCTAIRRILVPAEHLDSVSDALQDHLSSVVVGDPREERVTMGPIVSKSQQQAVLSGIQELRLEAKEVPLSGSEASPVGTGVDQGYFVRPTLFRCDDPGKAHRVHSLEVFGPVATLMPYRDPADAFELIRLGGGSLVTSVFTNDDDFSLLCANALGASSGRLLIVDDAVTTSHTGHGVVMPQCVHGGPGRAGGGQELGGLRGLRFYHSQTAIQGSDTRIASLSAAGSRLLI